MPLNLWIMIIYLKEKLPMISRVGFFFVLFFALLLSTTVYAQKKKERKIRRLETDAKQLYESNLYNEALDYYLLLDSLSPNNPEYTFRIGVIYYHSIDKAKSLNYFLEAVQNGKIDPNIDYYLARAYHFNLNFDSAVYYYVKALNAPDTVRVIDKDQRLDIEKHINDCQFAERFTRDPIITPIDNIGSPVNSPFPEYVPLITENEDMIIFTSRRPNTTGKNLDSYGMYMEDVYISRKNRDGSWSEPDNNLNINTPDHDACVGLNPDGSKIILYRSENGGDLYISEIRGGEWSEPVPQDGINTSHWESSASFTHDEKYLYFTSDKPGGYGGSDIYRAALMDDGTYGDIENLGDVINTPYDEDAPQIHSDGKTLFFSSKGHTGLGGYDIYSSVYLEEIQSWTEPRNIGYPINTPDDDIYFTLLANGTKGFFTSYRHDSYGEKDIYMITRPESVPTKFLMKFNLFDPYADRPINANISVTNMKTGESRMLKPSELSDGKYHLALDFEENYKLGIDAVGYRFKEKNLIIPYRADIFEYVMDIVPNKNEVISLVDSAAFIGAVESRRPQDATERKPSGKDEAGEEDSIQSGLPAGVSLSDQNGLTSDKNDQPAMPDDPFKNTLRYDNKYVNKENIRDYDFIDRLITSLAGSETDKQLKAVMEEEDGVIFLSRLDTRGKIVIPSINFKFDSYELLEPYRKPLDQLIRFLNDMKQINVFIAGHTDFIGTEEYNEKLSGMRASMVKYYLSVKGIESNRLHSQGFGETIPIWNNHSVLGRRLNRRVHMLFVDTFDARYTDSEYRTMIHANNIELNPQTGYLSNLIIWEKLPISAHFAVNHTIPLTQYSSEKIDILVEYLQETPLKLIIVGFEDEKVENKRLGLSNKRAVAVRDYLQKRGISMEKMMILDKKHFEGIYDVMNLEPGIERRRVQFFLVRD
jgi:outer membrane protein OmpA-like peptidoglycan-associated protein/tetratricopeptide (TPR) repeat protein